MKILIKKLGVWTIALAMIISLLPISAFAADESVIFAVDTSAYASGVNAGDNISVPVMVTRNCGFAGASLKAVYDSNILTLTGITAGELFTNITPAENIFSVYSTVNVTTLGSVAVLHFTVKGDVAADSTEISVEGKYGDTDDVSDDKGADVPHEFASAAILTFKGASATTSDYTANISTDATDNTVVNGDEIVVDVNVGGTTGKFSSSQVVLNYDPDYLEYKSATTSSADTQAPDYAVDAAAGTLTIRDYGETITAADKIYSVTFTAIDGGETSVEISEAGFSTLERAEIDDLLPATGLNTLDVTINHTVTVNGTDTDSVAPDGTFEYIIPNYDGTNNTYDITVKMDDTEVTPAPTPDENGKITISPVTGDLEITYTVTAKKYTVKFTDSTGAVSNITGATLADGIYTVTHGIDITFDVPANVAPVGTTDGYNYVVTVTESDDTSKTLATTSADNGNGLIYTIDGDLIEADITITVVTEVVPADQVTVTINGEDIKASVDGEELTSPAAVEKKSDVLLTLTPETGYTYEVKVGNDVVTLTDNQYTIENITESVTVTVTKTLDKGSVKVQKYLTLDGTNMWLVTINGNGTAQIENKTYSYDGNNMFWSSKYQAYCYLAIAETLAADNAKSAVGETLVSAAATAVNYEMDVNMSGIKDVNDVQLVWNMYNAGATGYNGFTTNVTMEKYLRADVNGSATVDTSDAQAIMVAIKAN